MTAVCSEAAAENLKLSSFVSIATYQVPALDSFMAQRVRGGSAPATAEEARCEATSDLELSC